MKQHEWIGIPLHDGWIVRVVFRPELEGAELFTYDCICKLAVCKGEPVRMRIPEGVAGVVLVVCVDGSREHEHAPVPMTLAKLPDGAIN